MSHKILIADHDPTVRELLQSTLEGVGYQIITAVEGKESLRLYQTGRPDLLILDVSLPGLNGYKVCRRVRAISNTPIIMLIAQAEEKEIVKGFDLGADDYLAKPFRESELLVRVQITLWRAQHGLKPGKALAYVDAHLSIDLEVRRVAVKGEVIELTPIEYKLLALLVKHKGRVLEYRQILESVWGFEHINDIDYLRVYIWHLRRKLEPDFRNPIYLINELSTGYRFEPQY